MIKGMIFDLDGTLISEREYILGCLENAGRYLELTYGTTNAFTELKRLLDLKWDRIFNRYFEALKIPYTDSDIQKLIEVYRQTDPVVKNYSDSADILTFLRSKNIKLALLTNGYHEIQREKVVRSGLKGFFDLILIPDQQGREYWKPNPWAYEQILETFYLEGHELAAVGDMDHDFKMPKALDMRCIYIEREDRMKDMSPNIKPDRKIFSLKEIEMEVQ